MKNKKKLYLLMSVVLLATFVACQNSLLPSPSSGDRGAGGPDNSQIGGDKNTAWGAPRNLVASNGEKRAVTLRWTPVQSAVKYGVYSSQSPFSSFALVAESVKNEATIIEETSIIKYYKVCAIDKYKNQSDFSVLVTGSTLAKPQITYIEPDTKNGTNEITVEWLMSNLNTGISTYENESIVYLVHYMEKNGTNQEGNAPYILSDKQTSCTIRGLSAKTEYVFKIQAYVLLNGEAVYTESDNYEESYWIDAETARKMRPDKPSHLVASQGMYSDRIELKWQTPEQIEILQEDGSYEKKGVFFKVLRSVAGTENYTMVADRVVLDDGISYKKGEWISFTDSSTAISADVEYIYKVQSYGDSEGSPTTNEAFEIVRAWKLMKLEKLEIKEIPHLGEPKVTLEFVSPGWKNGAESNKEDAIEFSLQAKMTSIFGGVYDNFGEAYTGLLLKGGKLHTKTDGVFTIDIEYDSNTKYYMFDLIGKYAIPSDYFSEFDQIAKESNAITLTTTVKPEPNFAKKEDGYKDKATFTLNDERGKGIVYDVFYAQAGTNFTTNTGNYSIASGVLTITGLDAGTEYIAKLRANNSGLVVESDTISFTTLGNPTATSFYDANSYDNLNIRWNKVVGAKEYTIKYVYAGGTSAEVSYPITNTNATNISGEYTAVIKLEDDAKDSTISGKPINVSVIAKGNDTTETQSPVISTNLLGPAVINLNTTQATSGTNIGVTWKKVAGAKGYRIYRSKNDTESFISYYYDVQTKKINLFESSELPQTIVLVEETSDGYTLTDKHTEKSVVENVLKDPAQDIYPLHQSQLRWDNTFTYRVVPLWSSGDSPKYSIDSVRKSDGYVLGYAKDVKASKGNIAEEINSDALIGKSLASVAKQEIVIGWKAPKNPGTTLSYKLYRRAKDDSGNWLGWNILTPSAINGTTYSDTVDNAGRVYEYLVETVAISASGNPTQDSDFIKQEAEKGLNTGFVFAAPTITAASKTTLPQIEGVYPEEVQWTGSSIVGLNSAGINYSVDGYVIEVKNADLGNSWVVIADLPLKAADRAKNTFTQQLTTFGYNGMSETPYGDKSLALLKVLRGYKHYFRARAYRIASVSDGKQTRVYSKPGNENFWGARQISHLEFAKTAIIGMSTAMEKARGNNGSASNGNSQSNLSSSSSYNWDALDYTIKLEFNNYDAQHGSRSGDTVSAVSISGILRGRGSTAAAIQDKYFSNTMTINYYATNTSGTVFFDGNPDNKGDPKRVSRNLGEIEVTWQGQTIRYNMGNASKPFTLPFIQYQTSYLNDTEEWK